MKITTTAPLYLIRQILLKIDKPFQFFIFSVLFIYSFTVNAQQCVHSNGYGWGGPYPSASAALNQHCSKLYQVDHGCFLVDGGASENDGGAQAGGSCMCPGDVFVLTFAISCTSDEYYMDLNDVNFNGDDKGKQEPSSCNPIDLISGNKYKIHTDIAQNMPQSSMARPGFVRTYNSQLFKNDNSSLGSNWRHNYQKRLQAQESLNEKPNYQGTVTPPPPGISANLQSSNYSTKQGACEQGYAELVNRLPDSSGFLKRLLNATPEWLFIGSRCVAKDANGRYVASIPIHANGQPPAEQGGEFHSTIKAYREDGNEIRFTKISGTRLQDGIIKYQSSVGGINATLTKVIAEQSYYIYTDENNIRETYNLSGQLTGIEYPGGIIETISYSSVILPDRTTELLQKIENNLGKFIEFSYYPDSQLIQSIETESALQWTYIYDDNQSLIRVINPDSSEKSYHYEYPGMNYLLTGVTDERGIRFSTFNYYDDGLAMSSYLGLPSTPVDQRNNAVNVVYNSDNNSVTDSRGNAFIYNILKGSCSPYNPYNCELGDQIQSIIGPLGSIDYSYSYDLGSRELKDRTNLLEKYEYGVRTLYGSYDDKGNPNSLTLAQGTTEQKLVNYTYDDRFINKITSITEPSIYPSGFKVTTYTYDDFANITDITINGFKPDGSPVSRSSTFKYNGPFHQLSEIDGPRTDVSDITYFDYYPNDISQNNNRARLRAVRSHAGIFLKQNMQYTATGKIAAEDQPNNLHISYLYYPGNDRLKDVVQTDTISGIVRTVRYTYLATGEVETITQGADSSSAVTLTLSYDSARRLTRITDGLNNYIEYVLDTEGNIENENIYDASGILRKSLTQTFDNYNRLETFTQMNEGKIVDFNPDGTINTVTDGNNVLTDYSYDSLKRLTSVVQDRDGSNPATANALTQYGYDVQNNLIKITDANNAETTYVYDDLGNMLSRTSPDTGIASYQHDAAGNIIQSIDAKGQTFVSQYDSNNRLMSIDAPDEEDDIYLAYDTCTQGEGKLCQITRNKSTLNYRYNAFSDVVGIDQSLTTWEGYNTANNTIGYDYDTVGHISSITYPSGTIINYTYNAAGKVDNVHMEQDGVITNLSLNISYLPFGKETIQTYGNSINVMGFYDQAYRPFIVGDPTFYFEYISAYDENGNIKSLMTLDDPSYVNSNFTYDKHQRLMSSSGFHGEFNYTYDKAGNKQTQVDNGLETTFSYSANSNRLTELNNEVTNMDENGNMTSLRGMAFTYTEDNRLKTTNTGAAYEYNGLQQRSIKHTIASGVAGAYAYSQSNSFIYDLNGELLAEIGPGGSVKKEYVYLNNQLLAMLDRTPSSNEPILNADLDNDGEISVEDFLIWYFNHRTDAAYEVTGDEVAGSDDINAVITCGLTQGSCVASSYSTDIYYVHNDHLGTPKVLTNSSGQPVWRSAATPFGKATVNNDVDGDGVAVEFNIRQPGQYYDTESGLYYNYFRYYDPETGRYITSDPIGLAGGINTYSYVVNNPLKYIDPLGLDWFRPTSHPYLAGREGTIVEPGRDSNGSLNLGGYIDDYVPAGHTFASRHDNLVSDLTRRGVPDWLVNIPTMPGAYTQTFLQELMNSTFQLFDSDLFEHEIEHDYPSCQ